MSVIIKIIAVVSAVYIWYMYNFFKTTVSFHHPVEILLQQKSILTFLKHPIYQSEYDSKICPVGNLVGWVLPIWIIWFAWQSADNYKKYFKWNIIIWVTIVCFAALLNLNAFVYLIPCILLEILSYSVREQTQHLS